MSFADIYDQPVSLQLLQNVIRRDRVPNAMLLWGPAGVGKRLAAYEFAKALNCAENPNDACGACLSCRKIEHGNHPDVALIAPVKKSRIIDVEAISGIIESASLKPYEARWRVFIILEADRMRGPAQNHLLKTLEEPLGNSAFLLVTEHPQLLLPTIRSRCHRVRFGALKPETVKMLLKRERDVDDATAESVAALAQGQMSRAFDLVDSNKREVVFDIVRRLHEKEDPLALSEEFAKFLSAQRSQIESAVDAQAGERDLSELSKEDREQIKEEQKALVDALSRRDTMELLYLLETWYRDQLVYSATNDPRRVLNRDQLALLESAAIVEPEEKIGAIDKARLYLERFINEERVFRDLFFVLAR